MFIGIYISIDIDMSYFCNIRGDINSCVTPGGHTITSTHLYIACILIIHLNSTSSTQTFDLLYNIEDTTVRLIFHL